MPVPVVEEAKGHLFRVWTDANGRAHWKHCYKGTLLEIARRCCCVQGDFYPYEQERWMEPDRIIWESHYYATVLCPHSVEQAILYSETIDYPEGGSNRLILLIARLLAVSPLRHVNILFMDSEYGGNWLSKHIGWIGWHYREIRGIDHDSVADASTASATLSE